MSTPWHNDVQQREYEAALPDRFEDAGGWIDATEKALTLIGMRDVPASDYGIFVPLATPGRVPTASVPALWELRTDYETLRLGAKYASVDGRTAARQRLNELYIGLRALRAPGDIQRYQHAIMVLQQYLLDPERRASFSKILGGFGIAPGQRLR